MLRAAIMFFILALFAMLFGAYGIAGMSVEVGRFLLGAFLLLAFINLIASLFASSKKTNTLLMFFFFGLATLFFTNNLAQAQTDVDNRAEGTVQTKETTQETSPQKRPGLFIEPGFTGEQSESKTEAPGSDGSVDGLGLSLRLGGHINDAVFAGLDGRYSRPVYEDSQNNTRSNGSHYNLGPVIGAQTPLWGIRVWGAYIPWSELDPDASNGLNLKFVRGNGYRFGAGVRVSVVSINLEYQRLVYDETQIEAVGPFRTNTTTNLLHLENDTYILGLSFPIAL